MMFWIWRYCPNITDVNGIGESRKTCWGRGFKIVLPAVAASGEAPTGEVE
jgi:hypothetical protein